MCKIKDKLIETEERAEVLRGSAEPVPHDAINTLDEWIDTTLRNGEGVDTELEYDLIILGTALSNVKGRL